MTKGYFADYVTIENNRETLENKREILNILLSDVVFLWGKHLQFKLRDTKGWRVRHAAIER